MGCLEEAGAQRSEKLRRLDLFTEEEPGRLHRTAAKRSHSAVPAIAATVLCSPDY